MVYGYDKTDKGYTFYVRDPGGSNAAKSLFGSFGEVISNSNGRLYEALAVRK